MRYSGHEEMQFCLDRQRPISGEVYQSLADEITAGLAIRGGLPVRSAETANRAGQVYGAGGATLRDIAREVLDLVGIRDPGNTAGRLQAAFSTGIGTDILTGVVNSQFMTAYQSSADSSVDWVIERELNDFRLNRRLRLGLNSLERVPRGGTADHVPLDLSSGVEVYRGMRFGRSFVIDERDLVDDDLDAVLTPFLVLGRGAAALRLDLVYSELLANAALGGDAVALFHATHANLSTTAALSASTLDTGMEKMRVQTEGGKPINARPSHLLVPAALEGLAGRLVRDMTTTTAPLEVRAEPRLSLGVTDPRTGISYAGSGTTWYLAAAGVPTIEFGRRTTEPRIDPFTLSRGQWGMGFSLSWDVGSKTLDFRGLHRATA